MGGGWDKKLLKSLLFTSKTKYITFGAISGTNVERKGYKELQEALNLLNNKSIKNYELLIFGSSSGEKVDNIKTHFLGYINDDETLRLAYSASDVFVVPSLAENLSNAIMESLSCGTPVVAFDIGGNSDMIDHKINGYLAKNTNDLANGIEWVLESPNYEMLSYNARKKVLDTFESKKIAKSYINEYQNILKQTKK